MKALLILTLLFGAAACVSAISFLTILFNKLLN